MEVEKQEYIFIKMHKDEAEKFLMVLEEIDSSTSKMPDWAKKKANDFVQKLQKVLSK